MQGQGLTPRLHVVFAQVPLFPKQASTLAAQVDVLLFFHPRPSAVLHAADRRADPRLRHQVSPPFRRRTGPASNTRLAQAGDWPGPSSRWRSPLVIFVWGDPRVLQLGPAAGRRDGGLRRRQAVDVAHPAHGRPARDQSVARTRRSAGQAHADLAGRDPQLLRARFSPPSGRAAGTLHHRLVPRDQAREATVCSARSTAAPITPA